MVVTDASSPIGLATAAALSRLGDLVLMGSSDIDACERAAAELRTGGGAVFAVPLDLTDTESIERFVASARYLIGDIDVLITEAGCADPDIVGIQHLATHLIPTMLKAGRGDVVLISPEPPRALHAWLSALQAEFVGTGLRAANVRPGGAADDLGRFIAAMLDLG